MGYHTCLAGGTLLLKSIVMTAYTVLVNNILSKSICQWPYMLAIRNALSIAYFRERSHVNDA